MTQAPKNWSLDIAVWEALPAALQGEILRLTRLDEAHLCCMAETMMNPQFPWGIHEKRGDNAMLFAVLHAHEVALEARRIVGFLGPTKYVISRYERLSG